MGAGVGPIPFPSPATLDPAPRAAAGGARNAREHQRRGSTVGTGKLRKGPEHGLQAESMPMPRLRSTGRQRRRGAISAEVLDYAKLESDPSVVLVHAKPAADKAELLVHLTKMIFFESYSNTPDLLDRVVDAFRPINVPADFIVFHQDAGSDDFFVVQSGEVEFYRAGAGGSPAPMVKRGVAGDTFGELALIYNAPRSFTVKTVTPCKLWALGRIVFNFLVWQWASGRQTKHIGFLRSVKLFEHLSMEELLKLADALTEETFKDGTCIIKQGAPGDDFFILLEGVAVALRSSDGAPPVELVVFMAGQCFGERALLCEEPRAASVVARGPCRVGVISKAAFFRLLGSITDVMHRYMAEMGYSAAETVPLREADP